MNVSISRVMARSSSTRVRPGAAVATIWKKLPTSREFCEAAFRHVGLDWEKHVRVHPRYHRPSEVEILLGDASKARRDLGWEPTVDFGQLVAMMVDADLALVD